MSYLFCCTHHQLSMFIVLVCMYVVIYFSDKSSISCLSQFEKYIGWLADPVPTKEVQKFFVFSGNCYWVWILEHTSGSLGCDWFRGERTLSIFQGSLWKKNNLISDFMSGQPHKFFGVKKQGIISSKIFVLFVCQKNYLSFHFTFVSYVFSLGGIYHMVIHIFTAFNRWYFS